MAALTLHPRSAQQMYTGTADHTLTAELVERVSMPVIASGDITDRATARGRAGRDRRGGGDGRPRRPGTAVGAARDGGRRCAEPEPAEVVAELVRFMREVVREMGEERAIGFLRKFYGWYLRGIDGAGAVRGELMQRRPWRTPSRCC